MLHDLRFGLACLIYPELREAMASVASVASEEMEEVHFLRSGDGVQILTAEQFGAKCSRIYTAHLMQLADVYGQHQNLSYLNMSMLVFKKGGFFERLLGGGFCGSYSYNFAVLWFSNNWPSDLEWPPEIPRLEVPKPKAELKSESKSNRRIT